MAVVVQFNNEVYVATAVPAAIPVNKPDDAFIVATAVLPIVHIPFSVASLSIVNPLLQIEVDPVIVAGRGLTVTVADRAQPKEVV